MYGAAYKVLDVLTVIPIIFMGMLTPHLTASWASRDHVTFARRLRLSFDAMSMMAIPLAIGAVAVSRDVMVLVSGASFAESGRYLAILILTGYF